MRKYLAVAAIVLGAAAWSGSISSAEEPTVAPAVDDCPAHVLSTAKQTVATAWSKDKWRDRTPVKVEQSEKLSRLRGCLEAPGKKKLAHYAQGKKRAFYSWRAYRLVANTDCGLGHRPEYYYTGGAVSCGTISCESGGNWVQVNLSGSTASGAYQILDSTWRAYGGGKFASRAKYATPREQSIIASRIAQDGDQWVC